jgi:hypothetical protein
VALRLSRPSGRLPPTVLKEEEEEEAAEEVASEEEAAKAAEAAAEEEQGLVGLRRRRRRRSNRSRRVWSASPGVRSRSSRRTAPRTTHPAISWKRLSYRSGLAANSHLCVFGCVACLLYLGALP